MKKLEYATVVENNSNSELIITYMDSNFNVGGEAVLLNKGMDLLQVVYNLRNLALRLELRNSD